MVCETSEIARRFEELGEPFAAGFYETPDRSRFYRLALAQRRYWEALRLPEYDGGALYPCGPKCSERLAVFPDYSYTFAVDFGLLEEKWPQGTALLREETGLLGDIGSVHTVGGNGYTHSIPRYERVLKEGLDSYEARVRAREPGDFQDGLLEVIRGIRIYHVRCLEQLRQAKAPAELIQALERVPFSPARTLYEALVAWNFLYVVDGCDNPGRLDAGLMPYYRGEDAVNWLREFFIHVDQNNGWSAALGPDYSPLTLQCLRAIQGIRRPSLELRVTPQMPQEIWQAAAEALATGCGQPSLYNEPAYQAGLAERFPEIPPEDRLRFNGGGCTETMLAGLSCVGSLDAGINLPLIFEGFMQQSLAACADFSGFYDGLIDAVRTQTLDVLDKVSQYQQRRAQFRPQPVRTLLIDDCIDKGLDFFSGGARYAWSVINFAGLINVVDSLLVIRRLVYDTRAYTAPAFLKALRQQDPDFLTQARACPCYGVDNEEADRLAADFAGRVFDVLEERRPWLGGRFLPSSIQFTTYADAGLPVPATPDGRADGEPLADSVGAVHGKDTAGPTALLNSAARLPLRQALGTPVLNLRLRKTAVAGCLRPLVSTYFERGGMQVQISCVSREEMLDALEHPQRHENLIVRIGGYSEYFTRLTPALQKSVLARTEFGG